MRRSSLLIVLLVLSYAGMAQAAIALDGPCTVSGASNDYGPDTFSHATTSSTNLLALCTHTDQGSTSNAIGSSTFNADALTALASAEVSGGHHTELWYQLAPATPGTFTVSVNPVSDPYFINVACSVSGVAQAAPTHVQTATNFLTTISATVPSAVGEFVLSCASIAGAVTVTPGAGETTRWNTSHDTIQGVGSTMDGAATSVIPDLTFDDNYFSSMVAVSFAPLAVAAGSRRQSVMSLP